MPTPIHIFRCGRHQPMAGDAIDFSEQHLAAIAAGYDPAKHEAPLVVGHPTTAAPAYGWVKGLKATSAGLFADADQLDPAFAEMVANGRFKKVSASFYTPSSPANPTPGQYYLRHVGFLGAEPPAVKGLQPVAFAESEDGVVTLDFAEDTSLRLSLVRVLRSFRDWLIGKHGVEVADQIVTNWELESLAPEPSPEFAEDTPMPNAAPTHSPSPLEASVDAERLAALEAEVASFRENQRRQSAVVLVEKAIADGRLTPAQAEGLAEFAARLPETDAISFAEGKDKQTPLQFLNSFLVRLPKQVSFAEASAPQEGEDDPQTAQSLAHDALCYQEKLAKTGTVISVTDAVTAVRNGKHKD